MDELYWETDAVTFSELVPGIVLDEEHQLVLYLEQLALNRRRHCLQNLSLVPINNDAFDVLVGTVVKLGNFKLELAT